MKVIKLAASVGLFIVAGLCEIGGGWLVWKSVRDGKGWIWFIAGSALLVLYGIIPTLQPSHFGRVYAAYGGIFIALSLLWGWTFDGNVPDRFDRALGRWRNDVLATVVFTGIKHA